MAKSKRNAKKVADKATNTVASSTTTNETPENTTNEPVAIKPMVPRTAPLTSLTETKETVSAQAAISEEIVVQFAGREINSSDISARVKQAYKDAGQTDIITSITSYVKPEENKVYFVINDSYQGALDY